MVFLAFESVFTLLPLLRTSLFILFTWVIFIFKTQLWLCLLLQRAFSASQDWPDPHNPSPLAVCPNGEVLKLLIQGPLPDLLNQ